MREVFATAAQWIDEGRSFALATLTALRDAAVAPIGTTIAVDDEGRVVGNIGAGCHESAIVQVCARTAADARTRTLEIQLTDDDPVTGSIACGAVMQVVVWQPTTGFRDDALAIARGERDVALRIEYETVTFERTWKAKELLVLVGATALAGEIAAIARRLDYRIVVVDPRPTFATRERVPDADEIVSQWPDECLPDILSPASSIVVLSHDPKFDLPALRCALDSDAAFIGLLGSRRTQAARRADLRAAGLDDAALARLHGPVGLDIGGATPAETALSILAEIVASRRRHSGMPLRSIEAPIHDPTAVPAPAP